MESGSLKISFQNPAVRSANEKRKFSFAITRRDFIRKTGMLGGSLLSGEVWRTRDFAYEPVEARYYRKLDGERVQCLLCPHECVVASGRRGHCQVRENRDGTYFSLIYGRIAAFHNDPIEKKPLYHFMPGSLAFSLATAGCNVNCKFCQNWELAQRRPEDLPFVLYRPEEVSIRALEWRSSSIAFTYNEPTVYTEFIVEAAAEARSRGVKTVLISNGYINEKPLGDLCEVVDAYKIDLKAFTESYYREVVNGRLSSVLDTLIRLRERKIWTEIVYLIVPTLNDDPKSLEQMATWIRNNLGDDVPLHFSRFYPKYKLKNLPPTPITALEKARNLCLDAGLHYVYIGNVPGHEGENTYCPQCHKMLIQRLGYRIIKNHIQNGRCLHCGNEIAGVWQSF
ncbi:MAG TPA: AmmeMemoRadiSam system radical SAM enzyme [bacterium]|nr:AmmeMemoRadiSam system radical SAM enzyme [bacterium]